MMDWTRLDGYFDSNREGWEALQAFVQAFSTSATHTLSILKAHSFEVNPDGWRAAVHQFKGGAAVMGAEGIVQRLQNLELAMDSGRGEDLPRGVRNLESVIQLTQEDLKDYLDRRWQESDQKTKG